MPARFAVRYDPSGGVYDSRAVLIARTLDPDVRRRSRGARVEVRIYPHLVIRATYPQRVTSPLEPSHAAQQARAGPVLRGLGRVMGWSVAAFAGSRRDGTRRVVATNGHYRARLARDLRYTSGKGTRISHQMGFRKVKCRLKIR